MKKAEFRELKDVLILMRVRRTEIADGLEPFFHDYDVQGCKYTICTWGVSGCSQIKDAKCPLDKRSPDPKNYRQPCFYTCMVFNRKPKKGEPDLDCESARERVLGLYDEQIQRLETILEKSPDV